MFVILIIAVYFSYRLSDKMTRPIKKLIKVMEDIRSGKTEARIHLAHAPTTKRWEEHETISSTKIHRRTGQFKNIQYVDNLRAPVTNSKSKLRTP